MGAFNGAVEYPIKVRDCEFQYGADAAIYAYNNGMWNGSRLTLKYYGRTAVRAVASFNHMTDIFLTDSNYCDTVFKFHLGNGALLENVVCDFEGAIFPATAYVWCDVGADIGSQGTRLTLRSFAAGALGRSTVLVELVGQDTPDAHHNPSRLLLDDAGPFEAYAPGNKFPPKIPGIWSILDLDSLPPNV